jgi:hypothetical protein
MFKIFKEKMIVSGDTEYGWTAKYEKDPNGIWGMNKENVVNECRNRYQDYLNDKLIRGATRYWTK